MSPIDDHLFILGLDVCESTAQLTVAYRRAMLEWHPDRFEGDLVKQAAATKHAAAINAAFERLSERLQLGPIPRCVPCYNRVPTSRPPHGRRRQRACHRAPPTPGFPDPDVCEVFVESSHIVSAGYDHDTGTGIALGEHIFYRFETAGGIHLKAAPRFIESISDIAILGPLDPRAYPGEWVEEYESFREGTRPVPLHRGLNDFLAKRNNPQTSGIHFHNIPSSAPGYRPEPETPTISSTRNATIFRIRLRGIGWSMAKRTEPLARGYGDNSRSNSRIAEGVG